MQNKLFFLSFQGVLLRFGSEILEIIPSYHLKFEESVLWWFRPQSPKESGEFTESNEPKFLEIGKRNVFFYNVSCPLLSQTTKALCDLLEEDGRNLEHSWRIRLEIYSFNVIDIHS